MNKKPQARHILTGFALCVLLGAAFSANSQTTVTVDSTKPWAGYMNVYDSIDGTQGGYLWGSAWGLGALTAYFNGTNSVTVTPNTNTWNVADPYWVNTNNIPFTGGKWMEENFYVDVGTAFQGQTVTFMGNVLSNTLVAPYSAIAVIKEFGPGYAWIGMDTADLVAGGSFTVTRTIGAGNIAQYGLIMYGPNADPATVASLGQVVVAVNNSDPSIQTLANQAVVEGQNASFSVVARGTAPLYYQWKFGDTDLTNGGRISGATSSTLNIASAVPADAGTYTVTVTNSKNSAISSAFMAVIPLSSAVTNLLIDSGFENGAFAPSGDVGWFSFNGGALADTNQVYGTGVTPVEVLDGTYCARVYSWGLNSYNGIYQDRPALPGQVYTANALFYTPTDDPIGGNNVCYLEVQFRDATGAVLQQCASALITSNAPIATWFSLTPTNIHAADFVTPLGTSQYMVAPAGTAKVRYQITYHTDPTVDGLGSVYVDLLSLKLREPVITATPNGSNVRLSIPTLYGPTYNVLYKNTLADSTWQSLTSIVGDGTTKTMDFPATGNGRFYVVNTQ